MDDLPNLEITLFNTVLQLPPARRTAHLEGACRGDRDLRRRIEVLLKAHEQAGGFLQEPATAVDEFRSGPNPPDLDAPGALAGMNLMNPGDPIGRYRLLEQLGEGGCGVVYLAEQEEPVRRQVALKIIKLGMDTRSVMARFDAERQALAMMEHPSIAKVYDAGATDSGRPYFVMELVRGVEVTRYCDQNGLSTRQRLELFIQVCQAVQHAHQKGIIHRDLKPSNILVTVQDGGPVPKIIDFGIAKATQGRLTSQTLFTGFEQIMGTPAYMSPEQATLSSHDLDTRTDIYSLGVLLYELLTGRTPFHQKDLLAGGLEEMCRTIGEKDPIRPSTRLSTLAADDLEEVAACRKSEPPKLIHLVRGDLDWIVMKCLEKDRSRRYETANGLAMDVRRFLSNEPLVARPPSNLYRLQKMIRRNKFTVAAGTATVLALVAGLGFSIWQYLEKSKAEQEQSRLREQAQRAQANEARLRHEAEAQELAARKKAYASDLSRLQLALEAEDLGRAQELLNRQRPPPGQPDLRGWEWRYFWQFCQSDSAFTLCQQSNSIQSVSFSRDGALLAVGTQAHDVTVWDLTSRRMIFHAGGSHGFPARLAFASDRDVLAFYNYFDDRAGVVLWDSRDRREISRLPVKGAVRDLAFAGDGRLFTADLSISNNIAIWDLASGNALLEFTGRMPGYGMGTVFNMSGDGSRMVHVNHKAAHSVQITESEGSQGFDLRVAEELTTALALSPDGRVLATGGGYSEGAIKLWSTTTRSLLGTLEGHRSWVSCLKFLPDGRTLVSSSADRTVRLWDAETRQPIRTLRGHGGELWTVDVSRDGRWLASGGKDGSVILWDLASTNTRPTPFRTVQPRWARWWTYSPEGRHLGVIRQGRLFLHEAATLAVGAEPDLALPALKAFAFSPNSQLLVATDGKGQLAAWDLPGQKLLTNFLAHPTPAENGTLAFLPDGRSLLTFGGENEAREWDVATWTSIRHWPILERLSALAVSSKSDLVASSTGAGNFQLIMAHHPGPARSFSGEDRIQSIALSPDDQTLAAASENGTLELWDTRSLKRQALLHGVLLGYHSVAISPDGQRVAAGSNGQEAIKLWDLGSHEEVATLRGNGSFFSDAEFSPDGNTIGARNWNGEIHLWTAPSWEQIRSAEAAGKSLSP